ncbi:unnamed protein product [Knipowitschia caucasica]|uniref:F-box domain-containing protein n=2 Tax=Knipowitschia caucasica TaxID=637954 RepID=A0AAV2L3G7_KNICA
MPNVRTFRKPRTAHRPSPTQGSRNFIENLPPEILMKILSYLDIAALYTLSHVSSRFYKLASDNSMWHKIFQEEFCNKGRKSKYMRTLLEQTAGLEDLGVGHWKRLYFKAGAETDMQKWRKKLHPVSLHTGLPQSTGKVLRELAVTWELIVVEPSKQQRTLDLNLISLMSSKSSVTLCCAGPFPDFQQISALQLVGIRKIAFRRTGLEQPAQRSLMMNIDMAAVSKSTQHIGQDKLVELKLLQSDVVVGLWKDQRSIAFVMFTLHKNQLLERCTQGSSVRPVGEPATKNIPFYMNSDFYLHGYQLHISLHNSESTLLSEKFNDLFFRGGTIQDGQLNMDVINHRSTKYCLSESVSLPWTADVLDGVVQDCCFMTFTLWQKLGNPLWCVSAVVCLKPDQSAHVDYDYTGDHFTIHFRDEVGQVNFHLVHDAERDSYVVTGLDLSISTAEINSHF